MAATVWCHHGERIPKANPAALVTSEIARLTPILQAQGKCWHRATGVGPPLGRAVKVPVVLKLGYDNLWSSGWSRSSPSNSADFTPPFGMVVFAMKAAMPNETTIDEIFSGSMPFFYSCCSARSA